MFKYIGAAVGHCAQIPGCDQAPELIRQQLPTLGKDWHKTIHYVGNKTKLEAIDALVVFSNALAQATREVLEQHQSFITFGGDHSCAIGTWSAVANYYGDFGLIWIDAHLDAHTPKSSPSHNLHGMPVAVLLGRGDARLTALLSDGPKLKPQNIVILGARCYEREEKALLDELGVRMIDMDALKRIGLENCIKQIVHEFTERNLKYGISFDLDALDPQDLSALGTPEDNGIRLFELRQAFTQLDLRRLIGLEITEYNPTLDNTAYQGIHVIESILSSLHQFPEGIELCNRGFKKGEIV